MSAERSAPEASTSDAATQPEQPKGYVVGQSITERFKYEPIRPSTPEEMAVQDAFYNNCLVRSLMSGAAGGVMGVAFGIFMGAMDPAALNSPAPLAAEAQQKTAMQVLRETYRTTKARSVCVPPLAWRWCPFLACCAHVSCAACSAVALHASGHDRRQCALCSTPVGAADRTPSRSRR